MTIGDSGFDARERRLQNMTDHKPTRQARLLQIIDVVGTFVLAI